jgi:NADH dehydrogenase FAD-containing subunit
MMERSRGFDVIGVRDVGGMHVPPFRYRDLGSVATIGRKRAIVWSVAHIYYLIVSAIVPSWR